MFALTLASASIVVARDVVEVKREAVRGGADEVVDGVVVVVVVVIVVEVMVVVVMEVIDGIVMVVVVLVVIFLQEYKGQE